MTEWQDFDKEKPEIGRLVNIIAKAYRTAWYEPRNKISHWIVPVEAKKIDKGEMLWQYADAETEAKYGKTYDEIKPKE